MNPIHFDSKKVMKENSDEELIELLIVRRDQYQQDCLN